MTIEELIEDYLIKVYRFASNTDGWCIYNIKTSNYIGLIKLIKDMEVIFPNIGVDEIVKEWWIVNEENIKNRVYFFMSKYRLVLGNKMVKAWDILDYNGREFNFQHLLETLPYHQNHGGILEIFDNWFDEQLLIANMKMFNEKKDLN